jgi:hypothetical protein
MSAVLEVQPKAELYERIVCHLGLKVTDCDIVTMQLYHMMQEKKEWHAARKVSIGFALRAKILAERKIVYNQENLAATHARREETNQTQTYTKLVNKVMPNIPLTGFAAYKSQMRSQATIAEEFRKGFKGVSFCQKCNIYSRDSVTKPHKCKRKAGAAGGKSQAKLYGRWKADPDSVKECMICGMYYLKTHKKCASAKSKAKLSAAEKRQIDERQDRDAGGTQPQEEKSSGLSVSSLPKTSSATHVKSEKFRTSKKTEKMDEDEEEEDDEEEEMELEEDDSDVDSDSSASYTPRNQAVLSTPAKMLDVQSGGVSKVDSTHSKSAGNGRDEFSKKLENEKPIPHLQAATERERKAKAAEWEANLPPRVDHPDARGDELYDEADLEALRFEKEIGRRNPFTTETESQRLSRDPMITEDWDSIIGNNCWVRSGVVDRVVSHINSTCRNKEILVSNVALEHALFPDISDAKTLHLFLTKNDPSEKAALWKQVRISRDVEFQFVHAALCQRMTPEIRYLLLPVNIGNSHWCLLIVNLADGHVELWDSLKSPRSRFPLQIRQDRLQLFIRSLCPDTPELKISIAEVPQQTGTNCGVFMLEFIRAFVNGQHVGKLVDVSEARMPEFRARIVTQLKEQEAAAPPLKKRARK